MHQAKITYNDIKKLPKELQERFFNGLSQDVLLSLVHDWEFWGRPEQTFWLHDNDYLSILYLTGRGWGKTKTGAEWIKFKAEQKYGEFFMILAPTTADLRETVIEGESGILKVCDQLSPSYNKAKMTLQFDNGVKVRAISMEEPDRIRGGNTTCAWVDELCAAPKAQEALDMVLFANRIPGRNGPPQMIITTTPKAIPAVVSLVKENKESPKQHRFITGAIFDNKENLSKATLDKVEELKGTRLYEQEALGKIIDLGELGVIKKSWIKKWPHRQPLADLRYLVCSYDTAYSERNVDKKALENDPSACTIWGICRGPDSSGYYGKGPMVAVLLDAWEDWMSFPDLRNAIRRDANSKFGPSDRKPDLMLIEKKSSGQSVIQELEREGLRCFPYQPGKDDKLTRLHSVTPLFAAGRIYIPESNKRAGDFMAWAQPVIDQLTMFPHVKHDDLCDTVTQALTWLRDSGVLSAQSPMMRELASGEFVEVNPLEPIPENVVRIRKGNKNPYSA